ncbi:MAG UNVERIFIED_CONTAM: hypothetical protein LVR18_34055 [Planctomycetaceae bacterium]
MAASCLLIPANSAAAPCSQSAASASLLFQGIPQTFTAWMSHGDQVEMLAGDFRSIASTATCPNAAVQHVTRPIYGIQFHPEVTHTELGGQLLANFVREICGCHGTWKISSLIEQQQDSIRCRVGSDQVICGLSGGVDSSVTAALISQAIGSQLSCIFVDNGLLRKGERADVEEQFTRHFQTDLHVIDASERFLSELAGVTDPQQKRKIIGRVFIEVFQDAARNIPSRTIPRSGNALPRRDRKWRESRWTSRHHQITPQRRWTSGKAGVRAC